MKPDIVRKRTKKFIQPQSDPYVQLKRRGPDDRVRRQLKGQILIAGTDYGSSRKMKHMPPSGPRKFLVGNVEESEVLLTCKRSYCAETACSVPSGNHKTTVERAAPPAARLRKPQARLRSEENEQTAYVHAVFVPKKP